MLFISGFLPSAGVHSGGQQLVRRVLHQCCEKASVNLIAFQNERERTDSPPDDFARCTTHRILSLNRSRRLGAAFRHPTLPLITSARFAVARDHVTQTLRQHRFDAVWCEFIQAASLLTLIPRYIPTTLVIHDLFHEALERRAALSSGVRRCFWFAEARRTLRWERRVLSDRHALVTLTAREKTRITRLTGRHDIALRPPRPSAHAMQAGRSAATIRRGTLLFFGLLSRIENQDAMRWFLARIWPAIRRVRPDAHLIIAGDQPPAELLDLGRTDVTVTGFVSDPAALFRSAHVAIAPLRLGSGVKIKVVDTLAAGIPTVATSIGAEGIDPSPLLTVADTTDAFASACLEALA